MPTLRRHRPGTQIRIARHSSAAWASAFFLSCAWATGAAIDNSYMGVLTQILSAAWQTIAEMSPYLLFGFAVAGVLSVFVSPELVERHLGGKGIGPVVKASLFGVPLPLCSCGVIPVMASLRRHGSSRGAALSFLISTPQTGVDSIMVTYSLLGPFFAILRPLVAFISGIAGGALANLFDETKAGSTGPTECTDECCAPPNGRNRWIRALRYGFVVLPRDIGRAMILGIIAAGVISALVPDDFLVGVLGTGLLAMLAMMVIGVPMYVCATASIPIAAALIAKGLTPGAALVFLITGPATNAAAIVTLWSVLGRRTTFIYLATVASTALASGMLLDLLFQAQPSMTAMHVAHEMMPRWIETACAFTLIGVLTPAAVAPLFRRLGWSLRGQRPSPDLVLQVSGMTCSHCASTVHREIMACPGVRRADLIVDAGRAEIYGDDLQATVISNALSAIGYPSHLFKPEAANATGEEPHDDAP
jgi:uncharacterized membrane protein YraQ (UPF0718 family)/copper chaperone CopZ